MDKKKSILNVAVSVGFKVLLIIMGIVVKRALISSCGNEVNGLNALYLSILGVLAVAELGVGSAITFCMYKPIVNNDLEEVAALYHLFRKLYLIIGTIITVAGLLLTPYIKYLAKDYADLDVNLPITFLLMLISVVLSYLFSAKTSLINAYKNNYITTAITSGGIVLQQILQMITLSYTKSFVYYLLCRIVAVSAQWCVTELLTRKKYKMIFDLKTKIREETKHTLIRSIRAMFVHKIGAVMVSTVDSLVISFFVGVVALGAYSNYQNLLNMVSQIIALVLSSLTSILGHLYVKEKRAVVEKYCRSFQLLNYCIGVIFYLGYFAIADNLVEILFFKDLVIARSITFVLTLNGFIQFMRYNTLTFRDATGTFYYDRWKPLLEGIVNLILSVILVKCIGITGVLVATIITNLVICHIIEPFVLYRHAFEMSPVKYYWNNYLMIIIFFAAQLIVENLRVGAESSWTELFVNGCISVAISVSACILGAFMNIELCRSFWWKVRKKHA